jgi:uncharacterized membrane protein
LELINDKLPKTPSRKTPPQFITRIVTGALCGAAFGAAEQALIGGLLLGAVGAAVGTLAGAELRARLTRTLGGRNLLAALIEDAIAIIGAILLVCQF